jgi:hypothetical protein
LLDQASQRWNLWNIEWKNNRKCKIENNLLW